ncbi:MAG: polysaccharide deacetylase family protein [Gammaproteobacteria bacterium]|nr:polysaccharide deacetylase family protein [Gammaproteobacteria bacterium]
MRASKKLIAPACLTLCALNAEAGVILLYHHVDVNTPAITSISPDQFDKHLAIIEKEGFRVLSLDTLIDNALNGDADVKEVAITFDDAYISIYREAFPRLKAKGWPFTIFVSPALVGTGNPFYLDWQQLKEMADHGVAIENHTMNHPPLVRRLSGESEEIWRNRVTREITDASDALTEAGFSPTRFAYPYGEYDLALTEIIRSLGLQGFGQQSGAIGPMSNPALLPRYPLAGVYVGESAFRDKLRSLALPIKHPDIDPLVSENLKPALLLDFVNPNVNTSRLTCYGPGGVMQISEEARGRVSITPASELPIGRSRYNCTLPKGNRYHWFSQLWMRKKTDGSWYQEP